MKTHSTTMRSLISLARAELDLAQIVRKRRLDMDLTQQGLSERSGVPLGSLRKFEQRGSISLSSFLKLLLVVGGLEEMLAALEPNKPRFKNIDEVLKDMEDSRRERGSKN